MFISITSGSKVIDNLKIISTLKVLKLNFTILTEANVQINKNEGSLTDASNSLLITSLPFCSYPGKGTGDVHYFLVEKTLRGIAR